MAVYYYISLNTKFDVTVLTEIGSKNMSVFEILISGYNFHYVLPAKKTNVEELKFTLIIHWRMLLYRIILTSSIHVTV